MAHGSVHILVCFSRKKTIAFIGFSRMRAHSQ